MWLEMDDVDVVDGMDARRCSPRGGVILMGMLRTLLVFVCAGSLLSVAQTPLPAAPVSAPNSTPASKDVALGMLLAKIEEDAQALNAEISRLRIDKWKTDSSTKQQASDNAASVQRNITAALPELVGAVRNAPQSLTANFKLYRNLNALYDVASGLGESTGAFGKKEEYESIAPQIGALDDARRNYGDYLLQVAQTDDARLAEAQRAAQAAAASAKEPPKKVIIDDEEPAHKTTKKRTVHKKKPAERSPAETKPPDSSTPK